MDLLRWVDARLGRWLAYADSCVNSEVELTRCQGFWTFVAVVLGVVCLAALAGVIAKVSLGRRKGAAPLSGRYSKPS
jgi:hypothetical protein